MEAAKSIFPLISFIISIPFSFCWISCQKALPLNLFRLQSKKSAFFDQKWRKTVFRPILLKKDAFFDWRLNKFKGSAYWQEIQQLNKINGIKIMNEIYRRKVEKSAFFISLSQPPRPKLGRTKGGQKGVKWALGREGFFDFFLIFF